LQFVLFTKFRLGESLSEEEPVFALRAN